MRRHVALWSMALVLAAGAAQAGDATQVLYDLSALQPKAAPAATNRTPHEVSVPTPSLPLSTPSRDGRSGDGFDLPTGDDLEVARRPRGTRQGSGLGAPRGTNQPPAQDNRDPSPTPEPGTLLLLGGALASGARFLRRR